MIKRIKKFSANSIDDYEWMDMIATTTTTTSATHLSATKNNNNMGVSCSIFNIKKKILMLSDRKREKSNFCRKKFSFTHSLIHSNFSIQFMIDTPLPPIPWFRLFCCCFIWNKIKKDRQTLNAINSNVANSII